MELDFPGRKFGVNTIPAVLVSASSGCRFGLDCRSCGAVIPCGYGLMDAVSAWSDCNRSEGRIYRMDEEYSEPYREPGDTITVTLSGGPIASPQTLTVTAGTAKQLDERTWAAIQYWTKLCITAHWFASMTFLAPVISTVSAGPTALITSLLIVTTPLGISAAPPMGST
jgi:hypothetical protein